MTRGIDLAPEDLAILQTVLQSHLPAGARTWVFGSRATGMARRYSDLDLAIEDVAPVDDARLGELRDALSESDLTIKVDVLDLRTVDPAFRQRIERDLIALPRGLSYINPTPTS